MVVGSHLDDRVTARRGQPKQILGHANLIVGVSQRVEDVFRTGRFGEDRPQHLLDAGLADTAGHAGDAESGETIPVKPGNPLKCAQRILHQQHRRQFSGREPVLFPPFDAERAGTGGDRRGQVIVPIEPFAGESEEKLAIPPHTRIGENAACR